MLPNPQVELDRVMALLQERHKLPRRVVLTRWLSSAEAVRAVLTCRDTYALFFDNYGNETNNQQAREISDWLQDNFIFGWYKCLQDVLPVLTGMNVLFQSSLPLPHLLYSKVSAAKATLMNMVGTGATRIALISIDEINVNTSFGAFANKFIRENREGTHGSSLRDNDVMQLKRGWHKFYAHCLREIDARYPPETMLMPTGNAISERGFSAMASTHGKARSEMSHKQVFAHMMIAFNGPTVPNFAANAHLESQELGHRWWGYINPNSFN